MGVLERMWKRTYRRSFVIHRPVEEVFDFTATHYFENRGRYVPGWGPFPSDLYGPVSVGTTATLSTPHPAGGTVEMRITVTEFELNRKMSVYLISSRKDQPGLETNRARRQSSAETLATTSYSPVPGGTRIDTRSQLWTSGIGAFWNAFYLVRYWRNFVTLADRNVDNLLDLLEGPSRARKVQGLLRRFPWGLLVYGLVLAALLWANGASRQLGLSAGLLQCLHSLIAFVIVAGVCGLFLRIAYWRN